jgi:hypothetical protein
MFVLRVLVLVAMLIFSACTPNQRNPIDPTTDATDQSGQPDLGIDMPETPVALTYHNAIKDLVGQHCVGCHTPGNIAPFELDNYEALASNAQLALSAIERGSMPPWLPNPECSEFQDQRIMPAEDKEAFRQWFDEGLVEGEASETPIVEEEDWGEPDIRARQTGPYTPTVASGDQYRCFVLDAVFAEDTFAWAIDVDPGNRSVLHHANMFLINPSNADKVVALETEDTTPGYPCFGDPGISTVNLIGAWVPGMNPVRLPDDSGIFIRKGSRIVMQAHYNTNYSDPAPVDTEFHIYTHSTTPERVVRAMPFANLEFNIPAGEAESSHVQRFQNLSAKPWRVIGAAAHMHLLATRFNLSVTDAGDDDRCILDIPAWDFAWQQAYLFEEENWVEVPPGASIELTCIFDNSPSNQPIIDGVVQTPKRVGYGGGTFDEMCISFLIVIEDYAGSSSVDGELCESFRGCRSECEDPFGLGCVLNCGTLDFDCGECLIFGAQRCANRYCRDQLRDSYTCLLTCAQGAQAGGDIDACLDENCPVERAALEECLRPRIEGGFCNDDVKNCNIEF